MWVKCGERYLNLDSVRLVTDWNDRLEVEYWNGDTEVFRVDAVKLRSMLNSLVGDAK